MNYEQRTLELIAENEALKCANASMRAAIDEEFNNGKPIDLVWLTREELKEYSDVNQAGGIDSIRLSAIRDLARTECPVGGYVIKSPASRMQMLEWANFEEKCNNER
tara:strand:- start:136 stop:456 length:321 start_codon:yes stop_codon:yes gene_type:complete